MNIHEITKIRRDSVRRKLFVATKERLTPKMLRIVFESDELEVFASPSPDDHIKIFIPRGPDMPPAGRDFTPRAWNIESRTLTIDFALHETGPATEWAQCARVGDELQIGGPRGSTVVPDDFDWYMLIGDSAALPSFGRRLEILRHGVPVHAFLLIPNAEEQQVLTTAAKSSVQWIVSHGSSAQDVTELTTALEAWQAPQGDGFIWIAAEQDVSREIFRYLLENRNHPAEWMKASAYWTASKE